ncbi:MAG TPA: S8 family serine peptidase [Acidobacteriota bacterium]|nr:S8 family serine peptidase [Acidobacteriota bacterium]
MPNDPLFPEQWGLKEINAEKAWDLCNGNADKVILAVLDSGIAVEAGKLSHPDLNDADRFFLGRDLINHDDDPSDDHGHGTHVTGIASATRNNKTGIAGLWLGQVLVIKVFDSKNNGSSETFKDGITAAVRFAKERSSHLVINYSGGGPDSNLKKTAVQYAVENGALLVAAAGNNDGGVIDYPAAYASEYSQVMAVGAVDSERKRPSFASRGPQMSVVAPGVDILSTLPNYYTTVNQAEKKQTKYDRLQGTSQAAPLVSALAALIWSKWPDLPAAQVREKITASADPITGSSEDFGHGMINAEKALT